MSEPALGFLAHGGSVIFAFAWLIPGVVVNCGGFEALGFAAFDESMSLYSAVMRQRVDRKKKRGGDVYSVCYGLFILTLSASLREKLLLQNEQGNGFTAKWILL